LAFEARSVFRYSACSEVRLPKRKKKTPLYELAKRGAEVQLRDLLNEAEFLIRTFPNLRDSFDKDELPLNFIVARDSGTLRKKVRRTRRVSAPKAPKTPKTKTSGALKSGGSTRMSKISTGQT
jgi:hypothetical protein